VWWGKLVMELQAGETTEVEVARVERDQQGLSEFLCARRYNLTPTGQDRFYPADGLPGKLVMPDNRCSLVRPKHLFLRPDLPFHRQARASRLKSAA
jgi:hypothetical protein